jgi:hypothetical protein
MSRRRSGPLPAALASQARACVEVAAQAARFFRAPGEAGAYAVHRAGLQARCESAAAAAAVKSERGPQGRDWQVLSRWLAEAARALAAGAAEAARFGVADSPGLAAASSGLRDCGRQFHAALEALGEGPRCEALLVAAKRAALAAQQRQRLARDAALDAPDAVRELKVRTVLRRLEAATEAWQQAVDRVAEVVGGGVI